MSEIGDEQLTPKEKTMSRPITISHQDLHFISRPVADYLYVKEINPDANH